jgi:hypothetical protein
MKIAGILVVVYVGYRLGRSDLRVHPGTTALTVLVAAFLHALVRLALPHDGIERIAAAVAWSWWSPVLVGVALLETSGLWIPVLLIRWTALRTRIAASAYIMGAATLGALTHYYPFDVEIWNGEVIGPTHPSYEVALVASLVFATVPFVIGWVAERRGRTINAEGLRTETTR